MKYRVLSAVAFIFQGAGASYSAVAGDLSDFLHLNERLPQAICDLSAISKAPTLESTRPSGLGEAAIPFAARPFYHSASLSEDRLIRFLMDDPGALLSAPDLVDQGEGTSVKSEVKRNVGLEVCSAQVTPGKIQALLERKPGLFLSASVDRPNESVRERDVRIELRDVDGRFGSISGRWWIAGWIEPFEVREARIGKRVYRRLAQPVTNQTRFIQVTSSNGIPLGFLYPTQDEERTAWETFKAQGESPSARRKQNEAYRLLLEIEAHEALARGSASPRPGNNLAESIRDLQEFYKSLLGAYQIYPKDVRFASYDRTLPAQGMFSEEGPRNVLDASFFTILQGSRLSGGGRVGFAYARPDRRLHAIYLEYRRRLSEL